MFHGDPGPDTPAAPTPQAAVEAMGLWPDADLEQVFAFGTQSLWIVRDNEQPIALVTVGPWQSFEGVDGFLAGNVETCP